FVPLVKAWLWVSVLASLAGWILSAVGQLNTVGYLVFFALCVAVGLVLRRPLLAQEWTRVFSLPKARRRFSRWLPGCFVVLAFLVFLSGALYAPTNHTGLTYRIPRVLQWLAHGQWFWIET